MTYIVTENCDGCKYTDCVEVCPVEAFHEGPSMLYINPETCIDCNACVEECPVEAIYADVDVPGSAAGCKNPGGNPCSIWRMSKVVKN